MMPGTNKVRFITLGCKVNQYETQGMREVLAGAGFEESSAPGEACHFVVINTCTVTAAADRENRYWIRRARRENPRAKIVVTGCYAEKNRKEIEALAEVDLIVSNYEKAGIVHHLMSGCATPPVQDEAAYFISEDERKKWRREYAPLSISKTAGRARAFVKIQDGCNHACSFCKVVLVRGRSRSRLLADIVDEARRLRDSGYREIVFAGIQLGAYGLDLGHRIGLVEVLEACAKIDGIERLRLSSIEPTDVRDPLIDALAHIPKCCPHLHIPLQSGDDEILRRMNRRYPASFYAELVSKLESEIPDFSLTLDVMAGFPGETEILFENTVRLLENVRPLKCHVFPYSGREGTRAAQWDECDPAILRQRVDTLLALSDRLGREKRKAYEGRTFPVLVEKTMANGLVQGLTPNYLKVYFQADADIVGNIVPVKLLSLQKDVFLGHAEQPSNQNVTAGFIFGAS